MAAQSSVREELDVLRRKEWARRNQETQQEKELYHESTPLFREPYKTNKGDELSSRIQRMLGNYEDGKNLQYNQYEGGTRDRSPSSSYGRLGNPVHKDTKTDPPFQDSSLYGSTKQAHSDGHRLSQSSKKFPIPDNSIPVQSKEGPVKPHKTKTDSWHNMRDYATGPPVLPDLSPPAEPLSPLHSSDSDQDMEEKEKINANEHSRSPRCKSSSGRTVISHHSESQQKEGSHLGGDAPMPASQTFPLPLCSKPNLVNSRKPMALVRPMDGPDQVNSESPDLKAPPDDYHGQPYENLSDLKTSAGKPNLPPLKIPSQSVEMFSNEIQRVEEILREMTHSWPPLLTAIQTPSTAEPSKFSFPNKDSSVLRGFQQPQKRSESPTQSPQSLVHPRSHAVCEDGGGGGGSGGGSGGVVVAAGAEDESGSSSDSESSSESESDSDSSDSGTDETPAAPRCNTPPAKAEGLKDINWQLISWIKESQPNLNAQNHADAASKHNPKPVTSTKPQTQSDEEPKPKNKKHYPSPAPPAPPEIAGAEPKPAPVTQHANHKAAPNVGTETGSRTTSTKTQSSLHVESVEVTPRNKAATFTERPKVKTKNIREKKSESRKTDKRSSSDKKDKPAKTTAPERKKEAEPVHASTPPSKTQTPSKNSKKSRTRSPKSDRKSKSTALKSIVDVPLDLVVKIQLSQLSRVPQVPTATKTRSNTHEDLLKNPSHDKETGKGNKKRRADHNELSVPKKKLKLEKDKERMLSSSSQQRSSKTEAQKSRRYDADRKCSEKIHNVPVPPKRRCGEMEQNSSSGSKHKKKSSSKEERKSDKKAPQSNASSSSSSSSCGVPAAPRPLLKFGDKTHPVDYHMKEAKKLKHKADATVDKTGKALSYLDAAMSFVESGIAMETDPQTPKSAYTMFSDTVDLIRFILKLKNYMEPSAPTAERDFLVLCMRCQALLQMAMFRCKRESALKYSRTLTDYFKSSKSIQAPSPCVSKGSSPMSPMPSPAASLVSNPASGTVSIPQLIQQMACSYINITALFLNAHETWEQAEELARAHTGLLSDLDTALGRLSLTSNMTSLVRYTRQGLHWLRLDTSNPRSGP